MGLGDCSITQPSHKHTDVERDNHHGGTEVTEKRLNGIVQCVSVSSLRDVFRIEGQEQGSYLVKCGPMNRVSSMAKAQRLGCSCGRAEAVPFQELISEIDS